MFSFSFRLNLRIHSKHHPSTFTLHNHGRSPQLTLYTQTIQAFRPRWNEENPSADPPLSRRVPGITRRDLRFAILLEQLYDTFLHLGKATQTRGTLLEHHFDQPTWDYLLARFIKSSLNKNLFLGVPRGPPSPLSGLAGAIDHLEGENESGNDIGDGTILIDARNSCIDS